jgi:hypothetical protein
LLPEPGTPALLEKHKHTLHCDTPYVLNVTATNADGGYTIDELFM